MSAITPSVRAVRGLMIVMLLALGLPLALSTPPSTPVLAQTVIATVPVGNGPLGVAVNPITNRIYVGNYASLNVSVIDGATNSVVATIPLPSGDPPWGVAVNPTTDRIYVSHTLRRSVDVIDGASNSVVATIPVDGTTRGVAVHPTTNQIYVAQATANAVSVIDGAANRVVASISVGTLPWGVAVHPTTGRIYVANSSDNSVSVIDGASNSVVATVPVGANPGFVAVHPTTNRIYVTNRNSHTVSVIDGATDTVVATVPVGIGPRGVGVQPTTNRIYVANCRNGNTVSIIDGATNAVVTTLTVGNGPGGVAVNPTTNRVYVTHPNAASDCGGTVAGTTVAVIDDAGPPPPPGSSFGETNRGGDIALADLDGNPQRDLLVFFVERRPEGSRAAHLVGLNLDASGRVERWSPPVAVRDWPPGDVQGVGIAVADVNRNGRPDLVVFASENPPEENRGSYRIGWDLDGGGHVTGGWTAPMAVPGWFGWENQGAGLAVADVDRNGSLDLVVFHTDNPAGDNRGYYRIGWDLDGRGVITGDWTPPVLVLGPGLGPFGPPGWFGWENQGAGIALADVDGTGQLDLVVFHLDNPAGDNRGYVRVGHDLGLVRRNIGFPGCRPRFGIECGTDIAFWGMTRGWTAPTPVPDWFGWESQGAGIAVGDIDGNGRLDLLVFHIDDAVGMNAGYYRIGRDVTPTGGATWSEVRKIGE